MKYTEK